MPKQNQLRRGTTAQHATFTGAQGEVTFDTTKNCPVGHDGATAGGFPVALEAALVASEPRTGNLVWVDAVNGNDATGERGRILRSFLTLSAAKAAADPGDTIIVLPGKYHDRNLLKMGVNWHFLAGAVVAYNGEAAGGIWDDSATGANEAVWSKITGHGQFEQRGTHADASSVLLTQAGSDLYLEGQLLLSEQGPAIKLTAGSSRFVVRSIRSLLVACVDVSGGTHSVSAFDLSSTGSACLETSGGSLTLEADTVTCSAGPAVHAVGGVCDLAARLVSSSVGYGLHVAPSPGPAAVTVRGARIASTLDTAAGLAVYLASGNDLTLRDCVLVSNLAGTPATTSIDAAAAVNVRIYGTCMANLAKGANVTLITGSTRFEVDSDVR